MVEQAKGWIKENSTLVYFLIGQVFVLGAGAASILAYMVRLEQRVMTMETRGAEYTVSRMAKIEERITVIEQRQARNEQQINRIVDIMTKPK